MKEHSYGCDCQQCKATIATITATANDGSYFYTDEELELLFGFLWGNTHEE